MSVEYERHHRANRDELTGDPVSAPTVTSTCRYDADLIAEERTAGLHGQFVGTFKQRFVGCPLD